MLTSELLQIDISADDLQVYRKSTLPSDVDQLIELLSRLNENAGEIGSGMLRHIVQSARLIKERYRE